MRQSRIVALALALFSLFHSTIARADVYEDLKTADRDFAAEVEKLSAWCREQKLPREATRVAAEYVERTGDRIVIFAAPLGETEPPTAAASENTEWQTKFDALRKDRANRLFAIAKAAAEARNKSLAYELLWETLRENPEHSQARRMLKFENVDGAWASPFTAKQLRAGKIWHAKYGWIGKDDATRYDQGERHSGERWITAEQDAKRHADIRSPWVVETEHYHVSTNHSLEEGVRLAGDLELLNRVWRQAMVDYWLSDAEFDRMFGLVKQVGPQAPAAAKTNKHRVVCYRDRDEYVRALQGSQPRVAMSLGVYLDGPRVAHFFAGKDQHPATVYHEATHQLFKETKATAKQPGQRNGIWLMEAVACYMESLQKRGDYWTVGDRKAGRFAAAQEKIDEKFYIPLAELSSMSADDLQGHPDIAKIYSQAAGMMTFLMHSDGGRYRQAVTRTLDAIYAGKATPATLARACNNSLEALDGEYLEFIRRAK